MRRLIISDLHIGSLFSREEKIIKLLKSEKYDELVLGGDIIDFIKIPKFTKKSAEIFSIILKLNIPIKYIIGNHDIAFNEFDNIIINNCTFLKRYEFEDNEKKIRIEHGDDYDNFIIKWEYIMNIICLIANFIERFFYVDSDICLNFWEKYRKKIRNKVDKIQILEKNKDIDIFIMGHTHTPEIINEDIDNKNIIYANSGDWVQHSSYLILESGKVYLKYII